jgi:uncharacterized protein (DUF1697 family)
MVAVGGGVGCRYADEMKTYVALFRGINVGGKNLLPMNELVAVLENMGLRNVETYIQSGNVVFQSEGTNASLLADTISAAINKRRGFEPQVLLLEPEQIEKAVAENPFPEAESEPKTLHLYFLSSVPRSRDLVALQSIKGKSERFVLKDGVFYLHAPYGIGRSKLTANAEKLLGVSMTGRNWRTVCKIVEMAQQCG